VSSNDPFQPQSPDQNKKRPFGRWLIAAVVVLIIIAVIGGFYLHRSSTYPTYPTYPTLYASYSGGFSSPCDPVDTMTFLSTLSLDNVVEDHRNGAFTLLISESGITGACVCNGPAHGSVTPSGDVRFTYVRASDHPLGCGDNTNFSGTIQSQTSEFSTDGGINGQIYHYGTQWAGNFQLAPARIPISGGVSSYTAGGVPYATPGSMTCVNPNGVPDTSHSEPRGITAGPDGALWFTEVGYDGEGWIGRISTSGLVRDFPLP
jgi:hypothetical protein